MTAMLEVRNLRVAYGKVEAVKGISFSVPEGQVVSLIGANGAGKTTTLRTISGLINPLAGEIWFKGARIDDREAHDIVALGLAHAPEGRKIFPRMTVEENLRLGAFTQRNAAHVAEDLQRAFDLFPVLAERRAQPAGTFSGGEQQMLAIARGLMANPRVLLLDEPSLGLSPLLVKNIFSIIGEINRQGVTILLVEQNVYQSLRIAHRAYVLETGRVVLSGTGEQLLNDEHVKKAFLGM